MTDASTPEPMSGESSSHAYESCDPAFLCELQASSDVDDVSLARMACLSMAQLRQLKTGGDSLFYSSAIKRQAYRRVSMALGAVPPAHSDDVAVAPSAPPTASQALENIVALSERREYLDRRPVVDALRDLWVWVRQYRQPLAALLLLSGALLLFLTNRPVTDVEHVTQVSPGEPVAPAKPPAVVPVETPPPAPPKEPVPAAVPVPTPAPVVVASASVPAPALPQALVAPVGTAVAKNCAYDGSSKRVELSSSMAQKAGLYVYVISPTDTEICVVDGKRQATTLSLRAGEGRSVYGAAPWQLSGGDLSKLQIYFQGWRVSLPEDAMQRVTLVEKPL